MLRSREVTNETGKAGVCVHPEEVTVRQRVDKYCEGWRQNPDEPVEYTGRWWKGKSRPKAGGGESVPTAEFTSASPSRTPLRETYVQEGERLRDRLGRGAEPGDAPHLWDTLQDRKAGGTSLFEPVHRGIEEPIEGVFRNLAERAARAVEIRSFWFRAEGIETEYLSCRFAAQVGGVGESLALLHELDPGGEWLELAGNLAGEELGCLNDLPPVPNVEDDPTKLGAKRRGWISAKAVDPYTLLTGLPKETRDTKLPTIDVGGDWDEQRLILLLSSHALSTNKTYDRSWKAWVRFCRLRGRLPIIMGQTPSERERDEEDLLDFAGHYALNLNRAANTVKQLLLGVRWHHVIRGMTDPLEGRPRLTLLKKALRKRSKVKRKWPVTANMLRWIRGQLDLEKTNDRVVWMTFNLGWFFLMRLSEYAAHDGGQFDPQKALLGRDVTFRLNNEPTLLASDAEEAGILFRISKADVFNAGEFRNHFRSGDAELCVVDALQLVQERLPHRFGNGTESDKELCRYENGNPVFRGQITLWIERAARQEGYTAERFGSHSLRIGGATALYHMGVAVEIIKRYGRWASDAFQGYLWESSTSAKGLAKGMAGDSSALMATRGR